MAGPIAVLFVVFMSSDFRSRLGPLYVLHCDVSQMRVFFLLCWDLTTRQPLWVILCRLTEKGRKEIEEIVEEIKERDREERGTGMKVKKQNK